MTTSYKESKSEENFNEKKNMTVQLLFCLKIDMSKKVLN